MKGFLAVAALVGAAVAAPQPQASPAACASSRAGTFGISVVNVTRKRDVLESRQVGTGQYTLQDGIFKDSVGRIGSIVANRQFQFDGPPAQAGAIYSSGWTICPNGSIAIAGNAVFYQCLSGNFYNIYDRSQGGQCGPVYIVASGGSPAGPSGSVSQVSDGQPQATTSAKVSQITDGQVQASTKASTSSARVSQISDGQVQATTGRPVSQITDGQVQAPTSTRPAVATFTGAAGREVAGSFAFVAGIVGAIALL